MLRRHKSLLAVIVNHVSLTSLILKSCSNCKLLCGRQNYALLADFNISVSTSLKLSVVRPIDAKISLFSLEIAIVVVSDMKL